MDEVVWTTVRKLLLNSDTLAKHLQDWLDRSTSDAKHNERLKLAGNRLKELNSQRERLIDAYQTGALPLDDFGRRRTSLEERILARLDRETNADKYRVLLEFLESIFAELLARADPSPTLAIVDHVSEHRVAEPPFAERPVLAAMWLDGLIYSSLAEDFVREMKTVEGVSRVSFVLQEEQAEV